MTWLYVIIIAAIIIAFSWWQKEKWKLLFEQDGINKEASEQYNYLKAKQIRCRLRQVAAKSQVGMMNTAFSGQDKIRIEVHKDDLEKAQELLNDYKPQKSNSLF